MTGAPGAAARSAFESLTGGKLTSAERWDQVAQAAIKASDVYDDFLFERKQVIALREVLAEIFTCLAANDPVLLDREQLDEWRERAGFDLNDGRHPDGCTCQFCREDEREERDREELDDDTDNTIPDTEGSDW